MKRSLRILSGLMVIFVLATGTAFGAASVQEEPGKVYEQGVACVYDYITQLGAGKAQWNKNAADTETVYQSTKAWDNDGDIAYCYTTYTNNMTEQKSLRTQFYFNEDVNLSEAFANDGYFQITYKISNMPNHMGLNLMDSNYKGATVDFFNTYSAITPEVNEWITVRRPLADLNLPDGFNKAAVREMRLEYQAVAGTEGTLSVKELAFYMPSDLQVKGAMYDCTEIFANNGWQWNAGTANWSEDQNYSSYVRNPAEAGKPKRFTLTWQPTGTSSKGRRIKFEKAGGGDSVPWDFTEGKNIGYLRITFKLDAPTDWFVLQWMNSSFQKIEEQQLHSYVVPNRWVQLNIPLSSLAQTNDVAYLEIRYKNKQTPEYENRETVMELADLGIYFPAPKFELRNLRIQKDGVDTAEYQAEDTLAVAGDVYNTDAKKDFKVITALYDGDVLIGMDVNALSAAAYSGASTIENVSFEIPQAGDEGTAFKVFAFDGTGNVIPLTKNVPAATKVQL